MALSSFLPIFRRTYCCISLCSSLLVFLPFQSPCIVSGHSSGIILSEAAPNDELHERRGAEDAPTRQSTSFQTGSNFGPAHQHSQHHERHHHQQATKQTHNPRGGGGRLELERFDTDVSRFSASAVGKHQNRIVLPEGFVDALVSLNVKQKHGNGGQIKIGTEERNATVESSPTMLESGILIATENKTLQGIGSTKNPPTTTPIKSNNLEPSSTDVPREQIEQAEDGDDVPKLPDFRHEDLRPSDAGERYGPQGRFSGGTNQYREDNGRVFKRPPFEQPYTTDEEQNGQTVEQWAQNAKQNQLKKESAKFAISAPSPGTKFSVGGANRTSSPYVDPSEITGSRTGVPTWQSSLERIRQRDRNIQIDISPL